MIKWIYCDDYLTDNNDVIKTLLEKKAKSSDIDQKMVIKNQINFIHSLLLMKDKLKKHVKTKYVLDAL
jgi:hypothetical protein